MTPTPFERESGEGLGEFPLAVSSTSFLISDVEKPSFWLGTAIALSILLNFVQNDASQLFLIPRVLSTILVCMCNVTRNVLKILKNFH